MKNPGLSTILLGFVAVSMLVSVVLMAVATYRMTSAATDAKVSDYWVNNKLFVITPTVTNVLSMALLVVVYVIG